MKRLACLIAVAALGGCDLDLAGLSGCSYSRNLADEISATGLTGLVVDSEDGDVRVVGRAGLNKVRVEARACSNDRYTTDNMDFELLRLGSEAHVATYNSNGYESYMDVTIEVPLDFYVDIVNGRGDIDVDDVYDVWISDGDGRIDVNDVDLDVFIDEDDAGDIYVNNVRRDLIVRYDRSGSVHYSNVHGTVQLP
jgi:hypothetical protein